jgi:ABC-type multidrug transport system ATPase subunit
VLFLDEPASGLDTVATRDVDELITGLGRSGVTIFLDSAGGLEMSMIGARC